jgi:hypothetical protein
MNYGNLRAWISDTLIAECNINADPHPPGSVNVPHAFVASVTAAPHGDFTGEQAAIDVVLLLGRSEETSAWEDIDDFVTAGSGRCVVDALEDNDPDGADSVQVERWTVSSGDVAVNDIPYIAVVFSLDVLG